MADKLNRADLNDALFGRGNRQQLVELVSSANPHLVAGVITKALEMQILAEEFAHFRIPDMSDEELNDFYEQHRSLIAEQLDRAINAFICAIVSQES